METLGLTLAEGKLILKKIQGAEAFRRDVLGRIRQIILDRDTGLADVPQPALRFPLEIFRSPKSAALLLLFCCSPCGRH